MASARPAAQPYSQVTLVAANKLMHQQVVHRGGAVHRLANVRDQAQTEGIRRGPRVHRRWQRERDDVAGACPAKTKWPLFFHLNGERLWSALMIATKLPQTVELRLNRNRAVHSLIVIDVCSYADIGPHH